VKGAHCTIVARLANEIQPVRVRLAAKSRVTEARPAHTGRRSFRASRHRDREASDSCS
jgi:hypothetical protein